VRQLLAHQCLSICSNLYGQLVKFHCSLLIRTTQCNSCTSCTKLCQSTLAILK
jgi:hypothetical protein